MTLRKLLLLVSLIAPKELAGQSSEALPGVESLGSGVYCRSTNGNWTKMEPISSRGFQSRAGFMSAKAVAVYPGAASAIQVTDRRPTFYLKEPIPTMQISVLTVSSSTTTSIESGQAQTPSTAVAPTVTRGETSYTMATQSGDVRNLVIVRLAKKKKQRELAYAGGSVFNFHSGIDADDLVETALTPVEGGGYALRPRVDLKTGEFLIMMPGVMGLPGYGYGFDFGVGK